MGSDFNFRETDLGTTDWFKVQVNHNIDEKGKIKEDLQKKDQLN